eukprot:TRINITY_DN8214_c0_g1_i1.p1 TRINITY_DN8214_c0_g1~~TRINITY_DN8214_c0_g1_i1.p1  ORF type:complete len:165 (-),score=41.11 TRINITY_DN8214_c0_g1_i1:375-869(-)
MNNSTGSSLSPAEGMQAVDLTKLNLMQLTQFKNGLDSDIQFYQESLQNLKLAQSKFQDSSDCMSQMKEREGHEVLVPLTGSMYVPGVIKETEKVLVDVGTGYYVEKDINGAKDYFNRKVKFVTQNMERVQAIGSEKAKIRDLVMDIMQEKLQAQFAGMSAANKS